MTEHEREQSPKQEDFARITPAQVNPGARAAPAASKTSNDSLPVLWVGLAFLVLLLLGAAVFFWLPQERSSPGVVEQTATEPKAVAEDEPREGAAPPPDAETLLSQREQAQALSQQLSEKQTELQTRNPQRWAKDKAENLNKLAESGATQFAAREYATAIKTFTQGLADADALLAQADKELTAALTRGEKAFADEGSQAATRAYELALAIAPDNPAAQKGLVRAKNLDEVLAKMRSGKAQEQSNDLSAARETYQAALKLDADYAPAREALGRVQSQLAGRAFSQQMSHGLAALEAGNFSTAKSAFQSAQKIRPGDGSAQDGLAQANAGLQQQEIASHRANAEAAASQEDWQTALDQYQAALALDSNLSFAQTGKSRAAERLALAQKLQFHLSNPQRLSDGAAQASAQTTIEQARAVTDAGSKLKGQTQQLADLLTAMRHPIPVQLVSDKRTQVLVYHVGDLGQFESKRLELTPGEYTAIGRCPGYRDVRRTISVKANQSSVGPISIQCEEKI